MCADWTHKALAPETHRSARYLDGLFREQMALVEDPCQYRSLLTPGRCGKTVALSRLLMYRSSTAPRQAIAAYVTDTRKHAKQIIFRYFEPWFDQSRINHTELVIRSGQSTIELFAADDHKKIERMRGIPYSIVVIDEAQSLRNDLLEKLVLEVINPRLKDYRAPLVIAGTPGEVPHGFFHEITTDPGARGYSGHSWDLYANIRHPRWEAIQDEYARRAHIDQFLEEEAVRYGGRDNPRFMREMLGLWTTDPSRLIYHLSSANHIAVVPCRGMDFSMAIDLGWHDATAWAVVGANPVTGLAYLAHQEQATHKTMDYIMAHTSVLVERFRPTTVWVDAAGAGKIVQETLAEEMRRRWGVGVIAAQKSSKAAYMVMLDNDLRAGRFLLTRGTVAWEQMAKLCWDDERKREAEGQPCDLADAVLYAYRAAYHWSRAGEAEYEEDYEYAREHEAAMRVFRSTTQEDHDDYLLG